MYFYEGSIILPKWLRLLFDLKRRSSLTAVHIAGHILVHCGTG